MKGTITILVSVGGIYSGQAIGYGEVPWIGGFKGGSGEVEVYNLHLQMTIVISWKTCLICIVCGCV